MVLQILTMTRKLLILTLVTICSCTAQKDWEFAVPELVVEGWIEDGGYPIVMVTGSVTPSTEYRSMEDLQEYIMKWAKVSISDSDTTVVLLGMPDKNYFPPYIFTTAWIKGEAGKTYDLKVEIKNRTATATTTVTPPEPITGLKAYPVEDSDSLYTIAVKLSNQSHHGKYYKIFTKIEGEETTFRPAFPGSIDGNSLIDDAEISIVQGVSIEQRTHNALFKKGSTVHVKFCTMDTQSWLFWTGFDDITVTEGSPFFPVYDNPVTNITGGLGYWSGYGATYYTITL